MSRPNFRIIEKPPSQVDLEEFKKDYLNPKMKVKDICMKYDISRNRYNQLRREVAEQTGVAHKPTEIGGRDIRFNEFKNIHKIELSGKYRLTAYKDGKATFYGNYDTLEIATEVRDLLIEHDWDMDYYKEVIKPKYNPSLDFSTPIGFEEDFMGGELSIDELREKYNLTQHQYRMISTPIKIKYGIRQKPSKVKV